MTTELANYLNKNTEALKLNQYLERFTNVPSHRGIVGRQYATRSNAERAIRRFKVKHFATFPRNVQLWTNRLDDGCIEIDGVKE